MPQLEFDIIDRFFRSADLNFPGEGVDLAIGDDCALVTIAAGHQMALSMDLLQEGVHFPDSAPPELLGQRALAVNLSDLAAAGAEPVCFTLGLSLPEVDTDWLKAFCGGLASLAGRYNCPLVGGDLIRGFLQIAIQVQGRVPTGQALLRSGARSGDLIYVTGTLGDAAAALSMLNDGVKESALFTNGKLSGKQRDFFLQAFYAPEPRIAVGKALRGLATAAIDISDGLLSDLGHVVTASGVGAELDLVQLPYSTALRENVQDEGQRQELALCGGDDYELCLTVSPDNCRSVEKVVADLGVPFTRIGEIVSGAGIECLDSYGEPVAIGRAGFSHFRGESPCRQA